MTTADLVAEAAAWRTASRRLEARVAELEVERDQLREELRFAKIHALELRRELVEAYEHLERANARAGDG